MDFTDWEFVKKAAPVIYAGGMYQMEDERKAIDEAIDAAIYMSRTIQRRQEEEMERMTGMPAPKKYQGGN